MGYIKTIYAYISFVLIMYRLQKYLFTFPSFNQIKAFEVGSEKLYRHFKILISFHFLHKTLFLTPMGNLYFSCYLNHRSSSKISEIVSVKNCFNHTLTEVKGLFSPIQLILVFLLKKTSRNSRLYKVYFLYTI